MYKKNVNQPKVANKLDILLRYILKNLKKLNIVKTTPQKTQTKAIHSFRIKTLKIRLNFTRVTQI